VAGPAKKVTTPVPGASSDPMSKGIKKFAKNPPKGDGQFTWRVRKKVENADTPWKSGGPVEIMEVVLRRLTVLESFEKSTEDIEKRINNLDKNILAVAQMIMPRPAPPRPPVEEKVAVEEAVTTAAAPAAPTPEEAAAAEAAKVAAEAAAAAAAAAAKAAAAAAEAAAAAAAAVKKREELAASARKEALATMSGLFNQVQAAPTATTPQKVSIIGAGPVGVDLAFAILNQGVAAEIAMVDSDAAKLAADAMDMQYGSGFVKSTKVVGSADVAITANSRLVVLTVGQGDGKMTPAELVQKNIAAFKVIIPKIMEKSPYCNLLVVSKPVDVMTYVAWKISGLPPHRVIGSGTNLESNRFRSLIADKLKLNTANCHGWIIGQQGPRSIPVWSSIHVAGVSLKGINPGMGAANDKENWKDCHQELLTAASKIVKAKRTASMALALSLAPLVKSMVHNSREVFSVSTMVKGYHGLEDEVFLSLPCVLGDLGVCNVIKQPLAPEEVQLLQTGTADIKNWVAKLKL